MTSPRLKIQNGFNLVELMVVISVLAVILSIAIPSFLDLIRDSKSRSQSNQILSYMHFARSEAVKRQLNIEAQMTQVASGWNIQILRPDTGELLRRLDVSDKSVFLVGDNTIVFDPRGRPLQQRCVGVTVENISKYNRQVMVLPGGKIAVEAGLCQ
ncbi:MAG: GspH/FimT family pseudopilin [Rheinheimera sp.]